MILNRKVTRWLRKMLFAVSGLSYKGTRWKDKASCQEAVPVQVRDEGTLHEAHGLGTEEEGMG